MRKPSLVLAVLVGACAQGPDPAEVTPADARYRIVSFQVKPGSEAEFERFFVESLLPAAEQLSESPEALERTLESFELLRPMSSAPDQASTYYLVFRVTDDDEGAGGQVMRDMVRRAFPPAEARQRIQRWMNTIDLESLVPRGEDFERVVLRPAGSW
jgi:hypothetical protein